MMCRDLCICVSAASLQLLLTHGLASWRSTASRPPIETCNSNGFSNLKYVSIDTGAILNRPSLNPFDPLGDVHSFFGLVTFEFASIA